MKNEIKIEQTVARVKTLSVSDLKKVSGGHGRVVSIIVTKSANNG